MLIEVTQADIKAGRVKETRFCPIALACKRQLTGWKEIRATTSGILIDGMLYKDYDPAAHRRYHDFMVAFDEGFPVEPFSFTIVYSNG